jgi:multidrug transporter EmrE-like cation transporter
MQMMWLAIAIVATVAYHLVLKVTPGAVNPFLSLAVSYAIVTVAFVAIYATLPGTTSLRESVQVLNWTAIALAGAIVFLDLGFLMLYRAGFNVSLGQLVTQSAAALLLLLVGVAFFRDKLSLWNIAGIVLCVVGLWLINFRRA